MNSRSNIAKDDHYKQLVELAPDAIAIHCEGRIVYVNPSAIALLGGKSSKDFLGREILEFVHPDYKDLVVDRYHIVANEKKSEPLINEVSKGMSAWC